MTTAAPHWNLELLWKLLDYPKSKSSGGIFHGAKVLRSFSEDEYHLAVRYFRNLKLKSVYATGRREIIYVPDKLGDNKLYLVEIPTYENKGRGRR